MNRAMVSLLLALSDPEKDSPPRLPAGERDWRSWLSWADAQGVLPIVSRKLESPSIASAVPAWVREQAAAAYTASWGRNMLLESHLVEFGLALQRPGLRAIVLKGPALAETVYPEMGMRPFTDIDLLIARADVPAASQILTDLGYQPDCPPNELGAVGGLCKACFLKRTDDMPLCIEAHWDVVNSPSLRARCSVTFEDLVSDAAPWGDSAVFMFPCPEDLLLTCVLHLAVGHRLDRVVLFVDLLQVLRRMAGRFEWGRFFQKADRCGAGLICASVLRLTTDLFPLPLTDEARKEIGDRLRAPKLWRLLLDGRQAIGPDTWGKSVRLRAYREAIKRFGKSR